MRRVNKVPGAHPGLTFMCGLSLRVHVVETRTDGIVWKIMVFTMHTARYVDMNNCERIFLLVDPIDLQCNPFDTLYTKSNRFMAVPKYKHAPAIAVRQRKGWVQT